MALLFACAARQARCQDPAGFNGGLDPAFRNVPLVWVVNAPNGSCTGVSIEYTFRASPPALWGCNQGTWTDLTAGGGGGGSGCNPTGAIGVVQASSGGGACENTSLTDNGTVVKGTEPLGLNLNSTALPSAQSGTVLQIQNANSTSTRLELDAVAASGYSSTVRWDGTAASPSALAAGDEIGGFNGWGYTGSAVAGPRVAFRMYAAQAWSSTAQGTYADVATTIDGGTAQAEVLRFENDGGVTVPSTVTGGDKGAGTLNAGGLYVNGVAVVSTATAPLSLINGTMSISLSGTSPVSVSGGTISITGAAGQVLAGASPAFTATPTLGVAGTTTGTLSLAGSTSGTATVTPQAVAGTPTLTLPNTSGTFAVNASGPLALNTTTGNLTCGSCLVNNSTNTGTSAMTLNMTASTGSNALQLPSQAGLTCSASGCVGEDTTATMYHTYTGGADSLVVTVPASTSITNGNCAQWVVSGSVKTLAQASGACGSGGGGSSGTNYYETWLTSGTSWTSPSWVDSNTTITVYGCGGGGGGGGVSTNGDVGVGGGAGGLFIYTATNAIAGSTAYTYAIGSAGAAGSAGGAGGNGGNTTFAISSTTYTANGGTGGAGNKVEGIAAGGTANNGTLNITGQNGWAFNFVGNGTGTSYGGSSMLGGGGVQTTTGSGVAGGVCSGGSGGVDNNANQTGGAGGAGLIHIIVSGS